ncbi:MAG: site-2 protease family protein [Patescibacteria group bacterium]|jgi:Zn-dependent protease
MPLNWLFTEPLFFLSWILAILVTLTIHEFSHALVANMLGDSTAKDGGRLNFNPLVHLDPLGFIMMLIAGFGWAKPVPVNPYNLRGGRWGMALVSFAGPLSNFFGVLVFAVFFKMISPVLGPMNLLVNFLFLLILINISLFVFNLIPIPPLDGSRVLLAVIPDKFYDFKEKYLMYGPYILLALVLIDNFTNVGIFGRLFQGIINILSRFL